MMSERDFDERLADIDRQYNEHRDGAEAARDQAVSHLFVECGWTQERIAQKMGQSQPWVVCRLRFGRFLGFITDSNNSFSPAQLAEFRFRQHWAKVGKGHPKETEAGRFARVLEFELAA